MNKKLYIYVILLWLGFAYAYLYPFQSLASYTPPTAPSPEVLAVIEWSNYSSFASRMIALLIIAAGLIATYFSITCSNIALLLISTLFGFSYCLYTTGMTITIEQTGIAINHGLQPVISGVSTIFKYAPHFLLQELLVMLFAISIIMVINNYITRRSTSCCARD